MDPKTDAAVAPNRRTARTFRELVVEYAIMVAIGVAIFGSALLTAIYVPVEARAKWGKWFWLALYTLLVFGFVLKKVGRARRTRAFQGSFAAVLLLNTGCFWVFLRSISQISPTLFVFVAPINYTLILIVMDWTTNRLRKRPKP